MANGTVALGSPGHLARGTPKEPGPRHRWNLGTAFNRTASKTKGAKRNRRTTGRHRLPFSGVGSSNCGYRENRLHAQNSPGPPSGISRSRGAPPPPPAQLGRSCARLCGVPARCPTVWSFDAQRSRRRWFGRSEPGGSPIDRCFAVVHIRRGIRPNVEPISHGDVLQGTLRHRQGRWRSRHATLSVLPVESPPRAPDPDTSV
jgi:hypothetical protein